MAAAAIVRLMRDGALPSHGARSATTGLELEHYEPWFAGKRIVAGFRDEQDGLPLYRRVLGEAWEKLPSTLQAMHASLAGQTASGEASVERGRNRLAQMVADIMGFPKEGERIAVRVRFETIANGEIWHRDFAGRKFHSVQTEGMAARNT